jgi:AcrR family transcriptional regulator
MGSPPEPEHYELPVPETARGHRTRTRLLDAAEAVFGELGYERASITLITQHAGVAQGTFYKYFPSKHAIFVELVRDFGSRMRHALAEATSSLPAGSSRADLERTGLRGFFAFALEHPGLYAVVREAQFVAPATYRAYYETFVSSYVSNLHLRSVRDPETLAWVVAGTADMLGLRWVVWERTMPPDAVLDQVRELLDRGFNGLDDA